MLGLGEGRWGGPFLGQAADAGRSHQQCLRDGGGWSARLWSLRAEKGFPWLPSLPSPSPALLPVLKGPPSGLSWAGPPARGAYRGGESAHRACTTHVLWAALVRGRPAKELGCLRPCQGVPPACAANLSAGRGFREAWGWAGAVGSRDQSSLPLVGLWMIPGGPSLTRPWPQPLGSDRFSTGRKLPQTRTHAGLASHFPQPLP